MNWILSLYPPSWKRRYRRELESHLLESNESNFRTALDLLAGATDAWLNPREYATTNEEGESQMKAELFRCATTEFTKGESMRSAGWMLGTSFVLTAVAVWLKKTVGDIVAVDALLYSAFFIALTLSSKDTYLRPYSGAAKAVIMVGVSAAWYAFFYGVELVSRM